MSKKVNEAEERVREALGYLRNRWDEIVEFYITVQNGELDCMHIDALVLLRSSLSLQLQVKSSEGAARRHTQRFPHIPVIVVYHDASLESIAEQIKQIISELYRRIGQRLPV